MVLAGGESKSVVFPTLADLGRRHDAAPFRIVDAGVPLAQWRDVAGGELWADPAFRKVAGFIARQLASTHLRVFRRVGDEERVRAPQSHHLVRFLADPAQSPGITARRLWEWLFIDQLSFGYSVAELFREDATETPTRMRRLPAHRTILHGDEGEIEAVEAWTRAGERRVLTPDKDLLLIARDYSGDGVLGATPSRVLTEILQGSAEAVQYRRDLMKRRAVLSGVIEREKEWTDEAAARFRAGFAEYRRGGAEAGGVPVLEDGMKWKDVQAFKPVDVQDMETRTLSEVEVATSFWIYPELIGTRPGTYANMRAFRAMLYSVCLGPYFDAWRADLNTQLLPLFTPQSYYIEPHIESKLAGSFEEQADYLSTMVGGPVMTRNEARARLDMSRMEGGDELIVPLNVTEGGQASPQSGKAVTEGEAVHTGGAREGDALQDRR